MAQNPLAEVLLEGEVGGDGRLSTALAKTGSRTTRELLPNDGRKTAIPEEFYS
jgi:hypothetical protein